MRIIEKTIGKKFEAGTLPEPQEICTKQLYKVMDELERTEVNETEIAPFLPEVFRKLEWLSKEDLVKRVVSREFGRFLEYYANAPVIEQPEERTKGRGKGKESSEGGSRRSRQSSGPRRAEEGYTRLFINLGKRDNFYAREIINLVNRHVRGSKIDIGRIDLTTNCSFFEVPSNQVEEVMVKMKRAKVGDRKVVIDFADREDGGGKKGKGRGGRTFAEVADSRRMKNAWKKEKKMRKDDWQKFFE